MEGGNLFLLYKKQIKALFAQLTNLSDWQFIGTIGKFNVSRAGPYTRIETVLNVPLKHLGTMLADTSIVTREQWDREFRRGLRPAGTLNRLCQFEDSIELINWNHSLRIQWGRLSEREILIIQSTATHPVYRSQPMAQHNDSMFLLKELDTGKVHVLYIGLVDCQTILMDCEMNMPKYRKIYDYWKCPNCSHMTPPHELECRHCKLERYRRCPDKRCFTEQREGITVCEVCGIKL